MSMPRGKRSPAAKSTASEVRDPDAPLPDRTATGRKVPPRCNSLDGRRWIQNSISVWSDIRKSTEEMRLKHPALFPGQLVERLIESFLPRGPHRILDPFAGTGSTLVAAKNLGKSGVGLELSPAFCEIARRRLKTAESANSAAGSEVLLHEASVTRLSEFVAPNSIDLCITSPPYWNILTEERTAHRTPVRNYGNRELDLGTVPDYNDFLLALTEVFGQVLVSLKPGAHCCVIVMDLRKRDRFFPFHSDLATRLVEAGFIYDDLIIWNRQADYNSLRPLGYPAVFRINKVHEFILLFKKPAPQKKGRR